MEEKKEDEKISISNSLEDLLSNENVKNRKTDEESETIVIDLDSKSIDQQNIASTKINSRKVLKISSDHLRDGDFIQCPHAIEVIPWTRKAFEDVILMAKAINEISIERWGSESKKLEVYCYVLTNVNEVKPDQPARISEIYIPYHSLSETSVDVSKDGVLEVQKYIKENDKVLLGWAHSHGHFKVYSSETDEVNHKTLLHDTSNFIKKNNFRLKYVYGITINEAAEKFGVVLTQYPCGNIVHCVDQTFDIQGDSYTSFEKKQRYFEIKKVLTARVSIVQPKPEKSPEDMMKEITEELEIEFIRKLRKSKNLLFSELPDDIDEHFELIQNIFQKYDKLLIDSAEETFTIISEKLIKTMKKFNESL